MKFPCSLLPCGALLAGLTLPAPAGAHVSPGPLAAQAQAARDVSLLNLAKGGLALAGHDPVSYFPEGGGKPLPGTKDLELVHEGVRYRFSKSEHLDLFKRTPGRFEPAYGGWCAWAMAGGDKVEVDPKSFLVQDGKLMLFYKGLFNDTRAKWLKDPSALQAKADAAWKKLTQKPKRDS
jgi:hypothetical protein